MVNEEKKQKNLLTELQKGRKCDGDDCVLPRKDPQDVMIIVIKGNTHVWSRKQVGKT